MEKRSVHSAEHGEQPLELILARNLISIVTLAAFLVDVEGHIVFYNDAAAEVLGTRFEETGSLAREQWNAEFGPLDERGRPLTIWGPPAAGQALRERLARYISNPLSPIDIRELPAKVSFRDALPGRWRIGDVEVRAALVAHRGPTLGYRLEADGASLSYLPDHEPGLAQNLATSNVAWISGHGLACDASLLIHDCQYTDAEYLRTPAGDIRAWPMGWPSPSMRGRGASCSFTMTQPTTTLSST